MQKAQSDSNFLKGKASYETLQLGTHSSQFTKLLENEVQDMRFVGQKKRLKMPQQKRIKKAELKKALESHFTEIEEYHLSDEELHD